MIAKIKTYMQNFIRSNHAIASIELSLTLPVFLFASIVSLEMNRYVSAVSTVNLRVATAADYIAQRDVACRREITVMLAQIQGTLRPFTKGDANLAGVRALSVLSRNNPYLGKGCTGENTRGGDVCWTWDVTRGPVHGNTYGGNTITTDGLPGGIMLADDDNYIVVEAGISYDPLLDITGNFFRMLKKPKNNQVRNAIGIYAFSMAKPRNGDMITMGNNSECNG